MNAPAQAPLLITLRWLADHARFPASRLPARAELLLLIASAVAEEEMANAREAPRFRLAREEAALGAALRARTERRKLVHYKCDNSVKV